MHRVHTPANHLQACMTISMGDTQWNSDKAFTDEGQMENIRDCPGISGTVGVYCTMSYIYREGSILGPGAAGVPCIEVSFSKLLN